MEEFKQRITFLQLQPFGDGRFEVFVNEDKIFSKLETHRFPEYEEIRAVLTRKNH